MIAPEQGRMPTARIAASALRKVSGPVSVDGSGVWAWPQSQENAVDETAAVLMAPLVEKLRLWMQWASWTCTGAPAPAVRRSAGFSRDHSSQRPQSATIA